MGILSVNNKTPTIQVKCVVFTDKTKFNKELRRLSLLKYSRLKAKYPNYYNSILPEFPN